jgi:hypothetical protein
MEDEGLQENRGKEALPDLRQVKLSQFLHASLEHNTPLHMGGGGELVLLILWMVEI